MDKTETEGCISISFTTAPFMISLATLLARSPFSAYAPLLNTLHISSLIEVNTCIRGHRTVSTLTSARTKHGINPDRSKGVPYSFPASFHPSVLKANVLFVTILTTSRVSAFEYFSHGLPVSRLLTKWKN